jgi:transposase
MNKKHIVRLSESERKQIFETVYDESVSSTVRKRCNILLLADESVGKPMIQDEIAKRCGVSDVTVYTTAKDYCTKGLEYVLRRRVHAKPPNAPVVNGEGEARIVALACGQPPDGYSWWSVRLLTKRIVELEIVSSIGRETVRRTVYRSLNVQRAHVQQEKLNLSLT